MSSCRCLVYEISDSKGSVVINPALGLMTYLLQTSDKGSSHHLSHSLKGSDVGHLYVTSPAYPSM